jgi:hypothetical protein
MRTQKMKLIAKSFVTMLFVSWTISCDNYDLGPVPIVSCDGAEEVSYLGSIKPIVDKVCDECHNTADFPTRDWTNKDLLHEYADEAARRVQLPVTDPDHMPLDPPELTLTEIKAIVCWAEQGAPTNN